MRAVEREEPNGRLVVAYAVTAVFAVVVAAAFTSALALGF